MFEKKVELIGWLQNPIENWDVEDYAFCGAKGCFSELSSSDIHKIETRRGWKNLFGLLKRNYKKRKEVIFRETSGRGHGAVLDPSCFIYSIDNLTRLSTLLICAPEYGAHLQQSLRRATAERGFFLPFFEDDFNGSQGHDLPENLRSTKAELLMKKQFKLYGEMQEAGVPSEDARFILPLYTKTTIQTLWNARELMHLHSMANRDGIPLEVKDTINQMYEQASEIAPRLMKDRGTNYETLAWFPSSQLFAKENSTLENLIIQEYPLSENDEEYKIAMLSHSGIPMTPNAIKKAVEERDEAELANLKHYHFTFLASMSLADFHQATRQRTWNQSVQTLRSSVREAKYITPPSIIESKFKTEYNLLNAESIGLVRDNLNESEIYGVLPHSLMVHDLIHINGWNAIHSIGKRTCTEAQWGIRRIATKMAEEIRRVNPELGKYAVPQGKIYGKCPEKVSCKNCFEK